MESERAPYGEFKRGVLVSIVAGRSSITGGHGVRDARASRGSPSIRSVVRIVRRFPVRLVRAVQKRYQKFTHQSVNVESALARSSCSSALSFSRASRAAFAFIMPRVSSAAAL